MKKIYLYLIAVLTWGVPGIMVATEGITAYCEQQASDLWWLLLITAGVLAAFFCMFRKIVDKYSEHIHRLPGKADWWRTFPVHGWLMLLFFAGVGIVMDKIPNVPSQFTASFYSGLGPMLIFSAGRFVYNGMKHTSTAKEQKG